VLCEKSGNATGRANFKELTCSHPIGMVSSWMSKAERNLMVVTNMFGSGGASS